MFIPTLNFTQTCLPTQHYFFSLFKTFRVQGVSSKLISIKLPEVSAHKKLPLSFPPPAHFPLTNFFPLNGSNSDQRGLFLSGDFSPK